MITLGCAHRNRPSQAATEELIQLLLDLELLDDPERSALTGHVLGVLQRNATTAGWPVPQAIEVSAVEVLHNHGSVCAAGEAVANISYKVVQ